MKSNEIFLGRLSHEKVKIFQRVRPWKTATSLHFDAALFPRRFYWILLFWKLQDMNCKLNQTILLCSERYYIGSDLDFHSGGAQLKTWPRHWPPYLWVTVLLHILQYRFSTSLNPWLPPSKSFHFISYPSPDHWCHRITCDLFPVPRFEVRYSMNWTMIDCTVW